MTRFDMFRASITPEDLPFAFPLFTWCTRHGIPGIKFLECKGCGGILFGNTSGAQVRRLRCDRAAGKILWKFRRETWVPMAYGIE